MSDRIALQNAEFDALIELSKKWATLQMVAVVDDDYPEYRHYYESAMRTFLEAIAANRPSSAAMRAATGDDAWTEARAQKLIDGIIEFTVKPLLHRAEKAERENAEQGRRLEAAERVLLRCLPVLQQWAPNNVELISECRSLAARKPNATQDADGDKR